jgi:hypothetical protein
MSRRAVAASMADLPTQGAFSHSFLRILRLNLTEQTIIFITIASFEAARTDRTKAPVLSLGKFTAMSTTWIFSL